MAIIKVFAVRTQLKKTVNYITDSEKTNSNLSHMIDYALNSEKTASTVAASEQFLYESVINLPDVKTAYAHCGIVVLCLNLLVLIGERCVQALK